MISLLCHCPLTILERGIAATTSANVSTIIPLLVVLLLVVLLQLLPLPLSSPRPYYGYNIVRVCVSWYGKCVCV